MKHIIFYSGGLGSWATARRVIEKEGVENVICMFTDTLIEDEDLYRFMLETTQDIYGIDQTDLIRRVKDMPLVRHESMDKRKEFLSKLAEDTRKRNHNFVWINDGRDPWDVFKDVRFLGNSRLAQCSHILKQNMSAKWLKENYSPEECVLYLGIDWTEEHRAKAPIKNWYPYEVRFPMCEEPYLTKIDFAKALVESGIQQPKLYTMNFSHNNCGGFCVRAGQGHFVNLLEQKPQLYRYHEEREQEMRDFLGKDVSILRRQRKGVKYQLTLKQLREEIEADQIEEIDMNDIGGCGCFVDID